MVAASPNLIKIAVAMLIREVYPKRIVLFALKRQYPVLIVIQFGFFYGELTPNAVAVLHGYGDSFTRVVPLYSAIIAINGHGHELKRCIVTVKIAVVFNLLAP